MYFMHEQTFKTKSMVCTSSYLNLQITTTLMLSLIEITIHLIVLIESCII